MHGCYKYQGIKKGAGLGYVQISSFKFLITYITKELRMYYHASVKVCLCLVLYPYTISNDYTWYNICSIWFLYQDEQ